MTTTRSSKRSLSIDTTNPPQAQKKVKSIETLYGVENEAAVKSISECWIKSRLTQDLMHIKLPHSTLPLNLYVDKEYNLFTIITVDTKKTLVTAQYGNGNGKISFKVKVNPMFIALEYSRLS